MIIRDLEFKDYFNFEKLHKKNSRFPLHHLSKKLYPVKKLIEVDDKIIGSALLHMTSEVSLILDSDLSTFARAKAIKEFFNLLPMELKELGLEDTHVFVVPETDESYARSLIKHFGFKIATGIPLYYELLSK